MNPRTHFLLIFCLTIGLTSRASADVDFRRGCHAHFASVGEAKEVLGQKDDFIQRLSPFDRAARMKTDNTMSEEEFLGFVKSNAATWNDNERTKIEAAIVVLRPALARLSMSLSDTV